MTLRRWVAILVAFAVLMPGVGHPCPPSRPTTWNLIETAELIVLGRVVQIRTEDRASRKSILIPGEEGVSELEIDFGALSQVELEVLDTWKGSAGKTVTLHGNELRDGLHAVETGDTLLVFLERNEEKWGLAGYEGYEELAEADVAGWRELVKRAVAVQAHPSVRKEAVRDWYVHAALHPPNRKEGLSFFYKRFERPVGLSREHQQPLAASFLADPGIVWDLPLVLRALEGHADSNVDFVASVSVDEALAEFEEESYAMSRLQDSMELLEVRLGAQEPGAKQCQRKRHEDKDETFNACVRARWERIRAQGPLSHPE